MKNFSELPLSAVLKSNLARHGFTETTPVQAQAIEPRWPALTWSPPRKPAPARRWRLYCL